MFLVAGISVKAGFISLGCSKNLVDTEVMLGILQQHGIELTANPAEADILIVNTCAFIQSAKEESITTILNMAEYKESGRCRSLIVAGCLGQRYKQELLDEIPEADAIIGTGAWGRIRRRSRAIALSLPARTKRSTTSTHRASRRRLHTRLTSRLRRAATTAAPSAPSRTSAAITAAAASRTSAMRFAT